MFGIISDLLDIFFEPPGSIHFQNDAKLLECDGFAFCHWTIREFFPPGSTTFLSAWRVEMSIQRNLYLSLIWWKRTPLQK